MEHIPEMLSPNFRQHTFICFQEILYVSCKIVMPLQSSGQIKYSQILSEFSNNFNKMSTLRGVASGVPGSGAIKMSNLYNKSASVPSISLTQSISDSMTTTSINGTFSPLYSVSDTYGAPLVYSITSKPSWLIASINSSTGLVSWSISGGKSTFNPNTLQATVTNRFNKSSSSTVTVNISMSSSMTIPSTTTEPIITPNNTDMTDGYSIQMSQLIASYAGDVATKITLPFSFQFLGVDYGNDNNGGIYIVSNSYIVFGGARTNFSSLGVSVPNLPTIHIASGDFSCQQLYSVDEWYQFSRYRVRFVGKHISNIPDITIVWEACFFTNNTIIISVSNHGSPSGVTMITNGVSQFIPYTISVPSTITFTGFQTNSYMGARYPPGPMTGSSSSITGKAYGNGTYVATSSFNYSIDTPAWKAFNRVEGDYTTGWSCVSSDPNNQTYDAGNGLYRLSTTTTISSVAVQGEWIQLQTPNTFVIKRIGFKPRNDYSTNGYKWRLPTGFILAGSTDGSTWTQIYTASGQIYTTLNVEFIDISSNTTAYNYYRLVISVVGNYAECCSGSRVGADIAEFYIYG
jgi:hypothetical protein